MTRWGFRYATAFILVAATACASRSEPGTSFSERGRMVIATGYRFITERYIDKVSPRQVAMAGLKGIHSLDPTLDAEMKGRSVVVRRADNVVALFKAPNFDNSNKWADTTVDAFLAARSVSPKIREANAETIYKAVFDSALTSLDKYSRYASAADARDSRAWREGYGGIGITIRHEKGLTKVVSVMPTTPAAKAGVKAEDTIVGIDGRATKGWTLRQVVRQLRGPRGSWVRLTLARTTRPTPVNVRVERRFIIPNTVTYRRKGRIAYIAINRFSTGTARRVALAVRRARTEIGPRLRGLVIDLRNNPGGLLDQAIGVSDLFLTGGAIVSTRGRHPESHQRYVAQRFDITNGLPIVVLVNGRSASSSEIVAAALQDNGRAVLVGTNSFGKGTVQSVTSLPNRGEMILTWSRFHAPSGYALQGLGVLPNVCTSLGPHTANAVVTALRNHKTANSYVFKRWRRVDLPSKSRQKALRKLCPASVVTGKFDVDFEVARRLISNRRLYQMAAQPTVARLGARDSATR